MDYVYFQIQGRFPGLGDIWWLLIWVPFFAAVMAAKGAGGASVAKRVGWGVASGILLGILNAAVSLALNSVLAGGSALLPFTTDLGKFALSAVWQAFLFALISALGGFIAETRKVK